jgi:hypothetical protein
MKSYHYLSVTAIALLGSASVSHADHGARGTLLRSVLLGHLEPDEITTRIGHLGIDTTAVRIAVDLYRLEYRTIDPVQRPTTASGLVAVPADHARASIAVSFTHGTELSRDGAPSSWTPTGDDFVVAPVLAYASAGFVVSAPDYLGMGTGPGSHPYMDVPSETTASLDMLRAARQFTEQQQRRLGRRVLITGFSQGAFPALGLSHEIGRGADPWFRVAAVAPISAPYHWSQWVKDTITHNNDVDPKVATVYLAYLSVAWNRIHQLYAAPSDWYQTLYADGVDQMMDGSHSPLEILQFLPGRPEDLFTTTPAIAAFSRPSGRLAAAFDVVDHTCDFTAVAPVRMFAASGDPDVAIDFSRQCRAQLAARGSRVELVDVGDTDHLGSNMAATGQILAWFTALRDRRECSADD